jgi:hypothetical protein
VDTRLPISQLCHAAVLVTVACLWDASDIARGAAWDSNCEVSIRSLRNAQEAVATAYAKVQSAQSDMQYSAGKLSGCDPSDCETERHHANDAKDSYNSAVDGLKSQIASFNSEVSRVTRNCRN